ncbi:hypothetical protein BH09ACT12_BH09ACT12_31520 [soil metagenome]
MYGDTAAIRRQADRMDERATDLRARARGLSAAADTTVWMSVGGDRMRERVAERRVDLEATADAYEAAAAALRHHAREVDEIKHLISLIERKVKSLITGALDRIRDFAGSVVDGVVGGVKDIFGGGDEPSADDERLASYAPPPPGDKAWLDAPDELGVRI